VYSVSPFWKCTLKTKMLKSIKINRQPFLKLITNLKTLLNWPNGEDGSVVLRRRKPEKGGGRDEDCVVWRMCATMCGKRPNVGEDGGRVCGGCVGEEKNEGEETGPTARSKIPDGCRESDSCFIGVCFGGAVVQGYVVKNWGLFWGCSVKRLGCRVCGKKNTVSLIFNHGQLWK